jgi:hypothetical protein
MIQRINQRESGRAIESPSIIKGSSDAHRRLVDVRDAKVDLPHGDYSRLMDETWWRERRSADSGGSS